MPAERPGAARLNFDASRCDGFGMCSVVFPERITLDAWGYARVEPEAITDRAGMRRALRAVRCCPRGALSLSEVSGPAGSLGPMRPAGAPLERCAPPGMNPESVGAAGQAR